MGAGDGGGVGLCIRQTQRDGHGGRLSRKGYAWLAQLDEIIGLPSLRSGVESPAATFSFPRFRFHQPQRLRLRTELRPLSLEALPQLLVCRELGINERANRIADDADFSHAHTHCGAKGGHVRC